MATTITSDLASFTDQNFNGVAGAHRMLMRISADVHRIDAGHNALGTDGAVAFFDGLSHARRRFSSVGRREPSVTIVTPGRVKKDSQRGMIDTESAAHPAQEDEEEQFRGRSRAPARRSNASSAATSATNSAATSRVPRKHEARPAELWGMSEINLARNNVGNDGLLAATYYVSKDQAMRELLLQDNRITLDGIVDTVVERLNASRLTELSLSSNPLDPDAVIRLFETLNAPTLRELHLSACNIPAECVPAICDFIRSPRSQNLWLLQLNGNSLGRCGVTSILDALEVGNFSISRIGMFANNTAREAREASPSPARSAAGESDYDSVWESDQTLAINPTDPRSMKTQIERRVPALQKRNADLTMRVRRAAARAISPTRIILHARQPTAMETATRVMAETSVETTAAPKEHFPLMDLPAEVRILIARHCSGDAEALTDAQWTRLRMHAGDKDNVDKMGQRMAKAEQSVHPSAPPSARKYKGIEVREAWLSEIGCWRWEMENKRFWNQFEKPQVLA